MARIEPRQGMHTIAGYKTLHVDNTMTDTAVCHLNEIPMDKIQNLQDPQGIKKDTAWSDLEYSNTDFKNDYRDDIYDNTSITTTNTEHTRTTARLRLYARAA